MVAERTEVQVGAVTVRQVEGAPYTVVQVRQSDMPVPKLLQLTQDQMEELYEALGSVLGR
jgi:hypothetical protein